MKPFLAFTESLHSSRRRAFYDKHPSITEVMYLVMVLLPLAGLWMDGLVGGVSGLTLFLLCYYLMPYVWVATHVQHHA
jgi:hypothetical protein